MQVRALGLWAGVAVTYSVQVRALVNLLSAGQGVGVVGWGGGNLLSAGQGRF